MRGRDCDNRIKLLDHTGDAAFLVTADNQADLLKHSVIALMCLMGIRRGGKTRFLEKITVNGQKFEENIISVLNRILVILETDSIAAVESRNVSVTGNTISLELFGRRIRPVSIKGEVIKAVTYHDLNYSENPYSIRITVDL